MKTPSVSTLKKSFRARTSSLKKTAQSIFHIPSPPRFVVFGVLGTAGPLEMINVGFMMTDYVVWLAFFWEMAGLDTSRSQCHSIRPIVQHFPEDKVVFGEAACERLRIPLPPCLDKFDHTLLTESKFCDEIRTQLQHTGETMKPGETLVLLLIGHGGASTEDDFLFYITTRYDRSGPACITKRQLELAVMHCKAEVIIICNSCKSGALESPFWTLLCAARSTEYAEALTTSQSGYARGSAFTLCALAQAGKEQGLLIPLPRSEPRPQGTNIHGMAKLPASPPMHSFRSTSSWTSQLHSRSRNPLSWFLKGMLEVERYLVMESETQFWHFGASDDVPWHRVLPLIFTDTLVHQIEVYKQDDAGGLTSIFHPTYGGSSAETLVGEEPRYPRKTVLSIAEAFIKLPHSPLTREGIEAKLCLAFLNNEAEQSMDSVRDLMYGLYSRHVQAIVVQELARHLGWWVGELVPFFSVVEEGKYRPQQTAMLDSGIPVDILVLRLPLFFPGIFTVTDRASSYWLASRWSEAGCRTITLDDWDEAVYAAAKAAVHETLLTDYDEWRQFLSQR